MGDLVAATRTRGVLLLAVIFFLGMVCGAALFYMGQRSVGGWRAEGHPPGPPGRGNPAGRLVELLDLDEQQAEQMREIVRRSREHFHRMSESTHAEMLELLRPDQAEKLESLRPRRGERGPGFGRPGFRRGPQPPAARQPLGLQGEPETTDPAEPSPSSAGGES